MPVCRLGVKSMDDLLREFLAEASESLDAVGAGLVRFEREPSNAKILDHIFRLVHGIKGTCGFLDLPRFEALVHATETLLEKLRDGEPATPETLELIYAAVERMQTTLAAIESGAAGTTGQKQHLQPIAQAWKRLPPMVSDLARHLGKSIELKMQGGDVSLDRAMINLIKDPLMHMVRNAADHGIETPQMRAAAGKPVTGKIKLSAHHKDGHIVIEVADDGRGLDVARIKREIVESGLASRAEIDGMQEQQILKFIFAPGFTTAATVTRISGRGVGMDIVCNNIARLGGTVDLKSDEGKGTAITIRIPDAFTQWQEEVMEPSERDEKLNFVIFRAGDEQKAVPLSLVTKIETIDAAKIIKTKTGEVVDYRGRLMPLIRLGVMQRQDALPVLVFSDAGRFLGLIVDEIVGIAENEAGLEMRGEPGIIGAVSLKGKVTEVIDIGAYLPCDLKRAQG
jgi:chemotaxis protein histidine kinase CheA